VDDSYENERQYVAPGMKDSIDRKEGYRDKRLLRRYSILRTISHKCICVESPKGKKTWKMNNDKGLEVA